MSSKVIGIMLIVGPILTMGVWILYNIETSDMSPSDTMIAIMAEKNKAEISASYYNAINISKLVLLQPSHSQVVWSIVVMFKIGKIVATSV